VYHGTAHQFDEFKYGDIGFHVGTKAQSKNRRKGPDKQPGETWNTLVLYASIKNPLRTEDAGNWVNPRDVWWVVNKALNGKLDDFNEHIRQAIWSASPEALEKGDGPDGNRPVFKQLLEELKRKLIEMGYDGIVYSNQFESKFSHNDSWIAFYPNQLKSVKGNSGEFSSEDKRITAGLLTRKASSIVAYHGTTSGGFDAFRPNIRKGEQLGFGMHFAKDKSLAEMYAHDELVRRRGKSPMVYTVELAMNKTLKADSLVLEGTEEYALAKKLAGSRLFTDKNENGIRCAWMQSAIDMTSAQRAEKLIREAGYDSVSYLATVGGAANPFNHTRSISAKGECYVVFDPAQIKIVSTEIEKEAKLLTSGRTV
jgi:hypothetical protein